MRRAGPGGPERPSRYGRGWRGPRRRGGRARPGGGEGAARRDFSPLGRYRRLAEGAVAAAGPSPLRPPPALPLAGGGAGSEPRRPGPRRGQAAVSVRKP